MLFDTKELNQSSFKGVLFNTIDSNVESGKRLTNHFFIDSGSKTVSNGNKEKKFTIKCYVSGSDYLSKKIALQNALDSKDSGQLIDTFWGDIEVFVDTYTINENISKLGRADFTITFIKAENKLEINQFISLNKDIELENASINNFNNTFETNLSNDILQDLSTDIQDYYNQSIQALKFMEGSKKSVLENILSEIIGNTNINTITNSFNLVNNIKDLSESISEFLSESTPTSKQTQNIYANLKNNINDLNEIDITKLNDIELITHNNKKEFLNILILSQLQAINENLENVIFGSGDSFGSTKQDVLNILNIIEKNTNDDILLNNLRNYKYRYITYITQKYSNLQNLENLQQDNTIDIFSLSLEKYQNISRIDEIIQNNSIVDPFFINQNLKVLNR